MRSPVLRRAVAAGALVLAGPAPQPLAAEALPHVAAPSPSPRPVEAPPGAVASGNVGSRAIPSRNAAAAVRSWVIESFEADIRVLRSGDVVVTETIRPRFEGSYNGIYRLIPVEYRTPVGSFEYDLRLEVEEVTDGEGEELRHEVDDERHYRKIKIWVPDAVDATRTVVIRYRTARALRHFDADDIGDAYDELYWNVTGDEWPVPIESVSAVVRLPTDATGVRARAWTGARGSREQAVEIRTLGSEIRFRATRSLDYKEGLTVAVAWDPGVVEMPGIARRAGWFLLANWPLVLPFLALGLMFRRWHRRGRDPELRPISVRYEPPAGLTPAEVGVVIDDTANMRDVTATIVDLAVRGWLEIEETEEKKLLGLLSDRDYVFHLKRPRPEWTGLRSHESKLLDALFEEGDSVRLSDLENEFYKDLPDIKDGLLDALIEHRVYERRPDKVKGKWFGVAIVAAILILVLGLGLGDAIGIAGAAVVVAALGTAAAVAAFGLVMPARTETGARLLEKVRGFEEFLERVESDRFRRMITGPEMFEKYLPFAMALGVEKKWAAAFEDIYREPPDWYRAGRMDRFHAGLFVADLNRMSARAGSAMQSSPRSSGGSGFSGGGGSVGGGFGGGGGGAF